jgi:hypothetical protein
VKEQGVLAMTQRERDRLVVLKKLITQEQAEQSGSSFSTKQRDIAPLSLIRSVFGATLLIRLFGGDETAPGFRLKRLLCRQFRDHWLIDFGGIETRLRVNVASHGYQRGSKDGGVPEFHNQILSNMVPGSSVHGAWRGPDHPTRRPQIFRAVKVGS